MARLGVVQGMACPSKSLEGFSDRRWAALEEDAEFPGRSASVGESLEALQNLDFQRVEAALWGVPLVGWFRGERLVRVLGLGEA